MKLISAERLEWKMEHFEMSCFNCIKGNSVFKAKFQEGEVEVNLCLCEKCLNLAVLGLVLAVFGRTANIPGSSFTAPCLP